MIINYSITPYVVFTDDEISHALEKISSNKFGIVFGVAQNGVIEGVLTDGDVRRWLLKAEKLDLSLPVNEALNNDFVSAYSDFQPEQFQDLLSKRIKFLPILDRQNRLVAVASSDTQNIQIDNFIISDAGSVFVIAEIGNNHNGDKNLAYELIDEAVKSGADCAKFQLRNMDALYRQKQVSGEDLGAEYTLDLLSRFQLSTEDMFEVFDYCKFRDIIPLCTPWDQRSLEDLERYGMPAFKIASADLTNHEFLENLAKTGKPLICSTGMSTEAEIISAVDLFERYGSQFIMLHCNSTYPAPFKDVNLKYLKRLKEISNGGYVGYSGHERGITTAIAAVSLGANVVEKHFTLDRDMEGNDHRVSLLPDEFILMVQGIREVEQVLGSDETRKISQGEMMNREVLGKSLVCSKALNKGELITSEHIDCRSPGKGLPPYSKKNLIGKKAMRNIAQDDFFYPSDLDGNVVENRQYGFSRPFGIPVRYHDFAELATKSNFDLVEFHFSYKDLELQAEQFFSPGGYDLDFVVHSPELFSGDHVMDLCSDDPVYRQRSIDELQRVVNLTREIKKFFKRSTEPFIIINAGGFTLDEFLPKSYRKQKYELIASSLSSIDSQGVEIIPQTMPPFPWHFGGQRFHNLFMDAEDIVNFCREYQMRICLDISHSKLACNFSHQSFSHFLERVGPLTAHLHVVDAKGVDGEGLQIGEGEIDFGGLSKELSRYAPNASFIPEIWQGHKNNGEGFWFAFECLEKYRF